MAVSVLFVYLGNICRSPLAEAALRHEAAKSGLSLIVDSAGTGDWHANEPPDERAQRVALQNGVEIGHLRARQIVAEDFKAFDHIIALDNQNKTHLEAMKPAQATAEMSLLSDYIEGRAGDDIADPYYGKEDAFEQTWDEVTLAARVLCQKLI